MRYWRKLITAAIYGLFLVLAPTTTATEVTTATKPTHANVVYATAEQRRLTLDLYLPEVDDTADRPPLVVWVHGGAWRAGSKDNVPILKLLDRGYAIASVEYRLSPEAKFPAQAHDLHAALRFLRAQAPRYGYDQQRFAIAGASAGGHLAALVGVTAGLESLQGELGEHRETSSQAQAIISFYGASNLQTILAQSTPHGLKVRGPALELLLGGQPDQKPELARLASPVSHVDVTDPPLLLIHGDQDLQMPINQAHELQGRYERVARRGSKVRFHVVHDGGHGGPAFYDEAMLNEVANFLHAAWPK